MAKKDKKSKQAEPSVVEEEAPEMLDPGSPEAEIQYTDTSYTSASFESLPPIIEELIPKVKKKTKKKVEAVEEAIKETSDLFNWSEEDIPHIEEQEKVVEEQRVKRKKGKKGKKEETEEIPEFSKPSNWRKMNKKERQAYMDQQLEEWRAQKELEKQALLASAKERRIVAAKERAELMVKDHEEHEIRRDMLAKTVALFDKFENGKRQNSIKKQMEAEWHQFLRCDGLPDPRVVTQMNTYLHMWREAKICDDTELNRRCIQVLPMLEMLDEFVANPRQYTAIQAQGYNEIRLALREQLSHAIECASYSLLRNLEGHLKMDSLKLATYEKQFPSLRLNLWVAIRMPTRKPKLIEPEQEPIELNFPSMKVGLKLPKDIDGSCLCVRAARSMMDLFSEHSRSFHLQHDIADRYQDLFIFNVKEHVEIYKLKEEQDEIRTKFFKEIREKIKELEAWLKANVYTKNKAQEDELDNLNLAEPPFLPDPRTFVAEQNELRFQKYLKSCQVRTRAGEVNLRKYRICGGILHLDLLTTPPQPKTMINEVKLTTLFLPKKLHPMKYQVQYRAPAPPAPGVTRPPEEIEAEMKKIEAEYEKLALVSIDLPDDIIWLEPPVVCQWQEARKLWTSNYINDFKYNEDKLILQFRTGVLLTTLLQTQKRLQADLLYLGLIQAGKLSAHNIVLTNVAGPIGLANLKYSNLPYQGWDLKPDPNGKGVILQVTGLGVTVTWICHENYVLLKWVTNLNTNALKEHFNKKYSVKKMVQIMKDASCDFFPDYDAHNNVEGSCPKEWAMERHNYHAMAFLSRAYNFQWSSRLFRWNVSAGSRNIVLQIREAMDKKREAKCNLLYVTPQRAQILRCNDMSQEFSTEPIPGLGFYSDLFTLNLSYGSVGARRMAFSMKYQLVETVFEMLQEIKLCSFS